MASRVSVWSRSGAAHLIEVRHAELVLRVVGRRCVGIERQELAELVDREHDTLRSFPRRGRCRRCRASRRRGTGSAGTLSTSWRKYSRDVEPLSSFKFLGAALAQELVGLGRAGGRRLRAARARRQHGEQDERTERCHRRAGAHDRRERARLHASAGVFDSHRYSASIPSSSDTRGANPEIRASERRVRVGVAHVPLLCRLRVGRRAAGRRAAADDLEHVVHRHARAAADVVRPSRHAALAGGDRRRDGVVHEREVARLLAVAVERDRLAPAAPPG